MNRAPLRPISIVSARLRAERTRSRLGVITLVAIVTAVPLVLHADDAPDPIPTSGMTQSIDVDLRTDPRQGLQVSGPVEWEPGRLTLGSGGSIRQVLDLGDRAKLTLRLAFAPLTEDGQTSTTRFAFEIRDRGAFVVQILRRRDGGKAVAQVQLIDQNTPVSHGDRIEKRTQVLRTFDWNGDFADEPWTFRLHHGLHTVSIGNRRLAIGYADKEPGERVSSVERFPPPDKLFFRMYGIGKPLDVGGWSVNHDGARLGCLQVSGSASLSDKADLKAIPYGNIRVSNFAHAPLPDAASLRELIDHPLAEAQTLVNGGPAGKFGHESDRNHGFQRIRANLGQHHPYYALALAGWGMQYHWAGKDALAEPLLKQAIEISEASLGQLHPDHASIVSSLAQVYRDMGRFDRAVTLVTQALQTSVDVFGSRSYRNNPALRQLAVLHQDFGRFAPAETLLRRALEASADAPVIERSDSRSALGELEAHMGESEKAASLLSEAQDLMEREHHRLMTARWTLASLSPVSVRLGNAKAMHAWILLQGGKTALSRQLARSAFLQMCQFENSFGVNGQGSLGGWNNWMMDVRPNYNLKPFPIYRQTMFTLANVFLTLGDYFPACGCIQVLDFVPGQSHHDLANIYRIMSKVRESHPRGLVVAYVDAEHLTERWRRETVYDNWSRIKNRKPDEPQPQPDVYWLNLAVEEFERSVGREHPDTVDALKARARQQWLLGGPEKAEATLRDAWRRALDLSDKVLPGLPEVQTYQFLGVNRPPTDLILSLFRATNKDRARDAFEVVWRSKALATRQLADRRQLAQAASGQPEVAGLARELESTRQSLATAALSVPTDNAVVQRREQLAALTGRKEDLERELARRSEPFRRTRDSERMTVGELTRRLPAQTAIVDLTERWRWTPPPLVSVADSQPPDRSPPFPRSTSAQKKGAPAQKKKAAGKSNDTAPFPLPSGRIANPPPPRASKPWVQKRCYDAFVVRPEKADPGWSVQWLELGDADTFDHLLEGWTATVRPGGRPDHALAQQLRDRLWKPIEAELGDCRTVIVVPDGRLAQVPWNALPGRRPDSYLIEDYSLVQAPYGQFIAHMLPDQAQAGGGFLLVGGIDYGPGGKWPYLTGTAAEVERLAELRPGPETVRLSGVSATQSRLRDLMPGRRFIHLATHGEFLDPGPGRDAEQFQISDSGWGGALFDVTARNPLLLSKLVLADANRPAATDSAGNPVGDDGFLTAEEVVGMDLSRNELVVLSACETGAGKVRGGEGVFSLQRAFHIAGARAVIASLWAVDDRATQALMGRFYQNLWANRDKQPGKLEALREAQLWLLRNGAEELGRTRGGLVRPDVEPKGPLPPSYWAAFMLSGDWR
jgi:CHAT domain-containing protein